MKSIIEINKEIKDNQKKAGSGVIWIKEEIRLKAQLQTSLDICDEIKVTLKEVQNMLIMPNRKLSQDKMDGINEALMFVEIELKSKIEGKK